MKALRVTKAINDVSTQLEKRHQLLRELEEAHKDPAVDRYRELLLECKAMKGTSRPAE